MSSGWTGKQTQSRGERWLHRRFVSARHLSASSSASNSSRSTLHHAHELFDAMATSAAAAKAGADIAWESASLTQQSSAQQKMPAAEVADADRGLRLNATSLNQQPLRHLPSHSPASPAQLPPGPSAPDHSADTAAFIRRARAAPPGSHQLSPPSLLRAMQRGDEASHVEGSGGQRAALVPLPSTPFAEQFIRRGAGQERKPCASQGVGSLSRVRRISYDSPMVAPLHMQGSPALSPLSHVSSCVIRAARNVIMRTIHRGVQEEPSTPSSTASPLLRSLSFGTAAAKCSGSEAGKSADAWHSKGYALRKKGNFKAAIEE